MKTRLPFALLSLPFVALLLSTANLVQAQSVNFSDSAVDFGNVNVCTPGKQTPAPCKATLALHYKVTNGGVFGTPNVLTLGNAGLDYTLAGSTCTGTVTTGLSCTVQASFSPLFPGSRSGAVQITGEYGNVLATTFIHGIGVAPQIVFDGAPAVELLSNPNAFAFSDGLAIDGAGNIYLANGERAEEGIQPAVNVLPAGGGPLQRVGAGFVSPQQVAVDGAGNVYVTDTGTNLVVEVPPHCLNTNCETNLDGGLNSPYGIAVDGGGNVYVAGLANNRVVELPAGCSTPACSRSLGSGLNFPIAVALDGPGNLFINDLLNHRVVRIAAVGGAQSTVVSNVPSVGGIAVDAAGNLFLTDGNDGVILEQPAKGGALRTLASGLGQVSDLKLDPRGNLLFSTFASTVALSELERFELPAHVFATADVDSASSDSPQAYTIENSGNATLSFTGLSLGTDPDFLRVAGPGTPIDCTASLSLLSGESCDLSIRFTPTVLGPLAGSAVLTDNTLNAPGSTQTILLSGMGGAATSLISFPTGFTSGSAGFTLNGGASVSDNALLLTDGGTQESRSVFSSTRVGVASFATSFDFQLTGKDGPAPDADGFTFVVQANGPNAVGSAGSGLGYGPAGGTAVATITNSVAIKFDLHDGPGEPASATGLYFEGAAPGMPEISMLPNIDLHSGHVFHVVLTYQGGVVYLTVTDQTTHSQFGYFFAVDIPGLLGGQTGYVGFTAATGGETAVQRILNWQFSSMECCTTGEPFYPAGFASSSDMALNGSAQISNGSLQMTQNTANETSSAYYPEVIPIQTFTSDFDVKLSPGNGEGFTFVLQGQGPNAIGAGGGGLGYGPAGPGGGGQKILHSVAIKFDLHSDDGEGSNSTGIYLDGASPTAPYSSLTPSGINLHRGHTFHVRLSSTVGSLTLRITDLTEYAVFTETYIVAIDKVIGSNFAYAGFTASTGELADSVKVLNWSMTSY